MEIITAEDAKWIIDNYDLVGNPGLAHRLKQIATNAPQKPETLQQWVHFFKNARVGEDVGQVAIDLLNKLADEGKKRALDIIAPKPRFQELFLYRCPSCHRVVAFGGRWGMNAYCHTCKKHVDMDYVAIDFARKIFFTGT